MRTRSASRLSHAPRPEVEGPPHPLPTLRLCPPHRATRRHILRSPPLSALLEEGFTSAGRGFTRHLQRALDGARRGLGALARGRPREGMRWLAGSLLRLPLLVLDPVLSVGARLVSGVQTRLGLEPVGQRLGARQLLELRRVFGDSIDAGRVCLKTGRLGLLSLSGRPFVLGNTLYVPGDAPLPPHLLVRALGRVWQYQHGGTDYGAETLGARWFAPTQDWREALNLGRGWSQLAPEQQLRLLQAVHEHARTHASGVGAGDDARHIQAAIEQVRAGHGAP